MNLFELWNTLAENNFSEKILAAMDTFERMEEMFAHFLMSFDEVKKKVFDFVENFPTEGLYQSLCSYNLLDIYYPPCLYLSASQTKDVFFILSEGTTDEYLLQVENIIQEAYNDELIAQLFSNWKKVVVPKRIPVLAEGIQCFFEQKYYACNALLLTQIGGIIEDNDQTLKQCEVEAITLRLNNLIEEQKRDNKTPSAEKNIAQRHLLINLQGSLCAFAEYFSKYLYSSGTVSPTILRNVANRNKVLHGEYCEFGTKLTALKTIIALDLLINLPEMQLKITEGKYDA